MAATATETSPLEGGKDKDPQEFLNGLMRDLELEGDSVFEASEARTHEKVIGSPVTSQGSTIELTEETHSVDVSPRKESKSVEPLYSNEKRKWNSVVRKTRSVHNAKKQWRRQAGIKPLDRTLKGPDGEALSPEEYSAQRLEMRKRELIGRTIEGELIPREKGKGYFIKWNRWRHDRVFMSAATIESVLGPRPKPGTMIRCTIIRLGPDHVPWNRQNPVANAVEHWFFRPHGGPIGQHHNHNRDNGPSIRDQKQAERNNQWNRSFSKQEWEYSGICTQPGLKPVYQMPPPSRLSPVSRSRSGSNHGSPVLNGHQAHDAFAERPKGRAEMARTWRSPHMSRQATNLSASPLSRQGTDSSLTSIPPLNLEHSVSSIGPRFLGQSRSPRFLTGQGRSGSLSEFSQFTRSTTGGTQWSNRSAGSPSK